MKHVIIHKTLRLDPDTMEQLKKANELLADISKEVYEISALDNYFFDIADYCHEAQASLNDFLNYCE